MDLKTLVPGVVLEARYGQPLVLMPAMGVHLSHHGRDHFIVEESTQVVSDRYHGGIELNYKFHELPAIANEGKTEEHGHHLFRRGGKSIKSLKDSLRLRLDPYKHGVIISSDTFAENYKLRIPKIDLNGNDEVDTATSSSINDAAVKTVEVQRVTTHDRRISTVQRELSPIYIGKHNWRFKTKDTSPCSPHEGSPKGSAQVQSPPAADENDSFNSLKLSRCYLTWESLHIVANKDGTIKGRPVAEFHMVFVADGENGIPPTGSSLTSILTEENVKAVVTYMISEEGDDDLPLLDLLFGTDEFLAQVDRQLTESTVDTCRTLCSMTSLESFDRDMSPLRLDSTRIETSATINENVVLQEDDNCTEDGFMTLPFGKSNCKVTKDCLSPRSPITRECQSPRASDSAISACMSPKSLSQTLSRRLSRKISTEEGHLLWRRLSSWEVQIEKTPAHGLYDMLNHKFTFMHYVKSVGSSGAGVIGETYCNSPRKQDCDQQDGHPCLVQWFVAEVKASKSQIDSIIRPLINLRQTPYAIDRDVAIGISHFSFSEKGLQ